MPAGIGNLGQLKVDFGDRKQISEDEFKQLLEHDRVRLKSPDSNNDVNLFTHGVFTYTTKADQEALLLQLTNGHPTVGVDWQSFPNTREHPNTISQDDLLWQSYLHYMEDRASAKSANVQLEPLLDRAISKIGAEQTTMIAFSHGSMFDTRYLRHRVDTGLPKVDTLLFSHPDVWNKTPELNVAGDHKHTSEGLLSAAASKAYVIGSSSDLALRFSSRLPGAGGERIGDDSALSRQIIASHHAVPVSEIVKPITTSLSQHFLNYSGIAEIENGDAKRPAPQIQSAYKAATEAGRKHST
jgi:hypothetical protein